MNKPDYKLGDKFKDGDGVIVTITNMVDSRYIHTRITLAGNIWTHRTYFNVFEQDVADNCLIPLTELEAQAQEEIIKPIREQYIEETLNIYKKQIGCN